ncbi:TetR/AcrR family transcriptional regulator [Paenibacillus sp. GCM10023250]|uniref:TetR/AcrR family transcriptional regulator n=1 Tax=Paenibacillus sp. GCM10023250 TaxID=3252648 RepID=UPI00361C774B
MNRSKKDHILNVASELFYKNGIRATGVDQVVAASNIAKMTLYNHFPSKDDLVQAYLLRHDERWRAWFEAAVAESAATPKERLLAVYDVLGRWFDEPGFNGCAFLKTASEYADPAHPYYEAAHRYKSHLKTYLAELAGQLDEANREELSGGLYLLAEGAIAARMLRTDPDAARHARATAELLLARYD